MFNKFNPNKLFFIAITLSIFSLQAQDSSDESADSMEVVITTARRIEESVSVMYQLLLVLSQAQT